jgi:NadR type nicotinamide-nucleotide adenylyltransferase
VTPVSVCLFGPESTGKTTLGHELAALHGGIFVPEFGRYYCETFGNECDVADLRAIVSGHEILAATARRKTRTLVIFDTDAVMTAVWCDVLLGQRPADLDRVTDPADLYLLADVDVPFAADSIRYFPDQAARATFFEGCRNELERRKLRYVVISGDWPSRKEKAVAAIRDLLGAKA